MGNQWRSRWELVIREPSAEGLLNALTEAGVTFHAPRIMDEVTVYLEIPYGQMGRARRVLEARGSELRLCRPYGLIPAARRLGKRYALLVSMGLCLALLGLSNLFVWRIDVTGNETVPTGAVLRAMADAGAGIGSFWPAFDGERLKTRLLLQLEEVQWVAVNYRSGAVQVVVREQRPAPDIIDNDAPVHIIAARSGVVAELSAKQGQACVGVGDTVEKGQLLISGAAASSIGTTRTVHALGSVRARTWHTISARIPAGETVKAYTGRQSLRISLILGGKRINFYGNSSIFGDTCDTITMDYRLCMEGVFSLPIRVVVQHSVYWTPVRRQADEQALEAAAREALTEMLRQRLGDEAAVVTSDFASNGNGESLTVTVMAECLEEIGEEVPIPDDELRRIQSDNTLREEATND